MARNAPPLPPMELVKTDRTLADAWHIYLSDRMRDLAAAPRQLNTVSLTAQAASITATSLYVPALNAGLYRVSYSTRITTAATVSSSLTVTLAWTDGAVALSQAGAAMTGNTTATQQNGHVLMNVDANTSVTYATTYATSGATSMQYALYLVFDLVSA